MKRLRAYFVQETDEPQGLAVIAETAKQAKTIAYATGEMYCDWVEIRVRWMRNANIDGLEKGVILDCMDALRRGVYTFIEQGYKCDRCGSVGYLQQYNGEAVCRTCYSACEECVHV